MLRGLVRARGDHVRRRRRGGARQGPARGGEAHEEGGAAGRQLVGAVRPRHVRRQRAAGTGNRCHPMFFPIIWFVVRLNVSELADIHYS